VKGLTGPDFIVYTLQNTNRNEKKKGKKLDRVCVYGVAEARRRSRLAGKRFSHLAAFQLIDGHEAIVKMKWQRC
jgi:hypothetical protein